MGRRVPSVPHLRTRSFSVVCAMLIMMTCYIMPVSAWTKCSLRFALFSEQVLVAANSAPILHTIGAVRVLVCESTTGYTFTPRVGSFTFPWTLGRRNLRLLVFETGGDGLAPWSSQFIVQRSNCCATSPLLISCVTFFFEDI